MNKDEILRLAREAGFADSTGVVHAHFQLEKFAQLCRADLVAELGQYPEIQAMLMSENKQLRAEVEAFDKAEDSWMRKAIELEAEVTKLRGLVAGRSAEYLAAHITYDKGYQEGRLDATAGCADVCAAYAHQILTSEGAALYVDKASAALDLKKVIEGMQ